MIRAFIAIELPESIQQQLDEVMSGLKKQMPSMALRWAPAPNIHLTLKFLGDVSPTNIPLLTEVLTAAGAAQPAFEISVAGLGTFPNAHRPRVVWVGVTAPPQLAALQHEIDQQTTRLGYPGEDRPFSPHLTLGRVGRNPNPADLPLLVKALTATQVGLLGTVQVQAVHLFRSELKSSGSIYTRLFSASLAPHPPKP